MNAAGDPRFTLCIFSENSPGVLQRITVLFTRRKLNIESLTVSETERPGVSRFTIVVAAERELVEKVAKQIHRIIEVFDVYVCENDELIFKEVAFFKVRTKNNGDQKKIEELASEYLARVCFKKDPFVVLEMTGSEDEVRALYLKLEPFGMAEFVRSGRIALLKDFRPVDENIPAADTMTNEMTSGLI